MHYWYSAKLRVSSINITKYEINKNLAFFNSKENHEGLRRKTNGRAYPLNLGPRILKIVVFGARRRLLHPHFGL
jgi:hypothetical protein